MSKAMTSHDAVPAAIRLASGRASVALLTAATVFASIGLVVLAGASSLGSFPGAAVPPVESFLNWLMPLLGMSLAVWPFQRVLSRGERLAFAAVASFDVLGVFCGVSFFHIVH